MAFCRSVLVLSVLCVIHSVTSHETVKPLVPVFLWGDLGTKTVPVESNPLSKVSFTEFNLVLKHELQNNPFTVVFIEETLSPEDFSLKNSYGETSFPYLHSNIGKAVYLSSVESSLSVLNKLAAPEKVNHVKLTENGLSAEIEPDSGNFLFINMKDAKEGESRSDLLRRHNDFMEDLYAKLKKQYSEVVAVYTSHYPSWTTSAPTRVRRQAETASNDVYQLDGLMLHVGSLVLKDGNRTTTLAGATSQSATLNNTELEATLGFGDNTLVLYFDQAGGYWYFKKIQLTEKGQGAPNVEELLPLEPVYCLQGFSYSCGGSIVFSSINTTTDYTVTFNDVQLEAYTSENQTAFSEPLDCVGFFSAPIWAGLLVVFILLAITFYGIMMMMDIKTMDQFDDPKGKTITINTSE